MFWEQKTVTTSVNSAESGIVAHGQSSNLTVIFDVGNDILALNGYSATSTWSHFVTRFATHKLWYRLTWELFPEKSLRVTSMAATAPLHMPTDIQIATHVDVIYIAESRQLSVTGWNTGARWRFELDDRCARQLWTALDLVLYPAGWAGASITYRRHLS